MTATGVGKAIRRARRAKDVSQVQLAERMGVRQATVSAWEVETSDPSLDTIARIEELLELPKGQLLVDAGLVDVTLIAEEWEVTPLLAGLALEDALVRARLAADAERRDSLQGCVPVHELGPEHQAQILDLLERALGDRATTGPVIVHFG